MNIILKDEDYEKKKGKIRLYEHEATENTEKSMSSANMTRRCKSYGTEHTKLKHKYMESLVYREQVGFIPH